MFEKAQDEMSLVYGGYKEKDLAIADWSSFTLDGNSCYKT
jgi:hypothetical protein